MTRQITLRYDGESTIQANNLGQLNGILNKLTNAQKDNGDLTVESGSLRWRDGGIWLSITASYQTTTDNIDTDERAFANAIADAGFEASNDKVMEEMSIA